MKLFTTKQIGLIDKFTIENEPVADIDLMERAAWKISHWLMKNIPLSGKIIVFAGPGNNGGDALAIARQLAERNYKTELFLMNNNRDLKGSPAVNLQRLKEQKKVPVTMITSIEDFPAVDDEDIIIDGLFGSGLTRPLSGLPADIVQRLNKLPNKVIAIDIPSGLMGENNIGNDPLNIVNADFTLTFQFPKLSFLLPENEPYVGIWEVMDIGLHPEGMARLASDWHLLEHRDVATMISQRSRFAHKGIFGHALLLAGSYGKMGAAVLASKACLRAGVGLLTTHIPHFGYPVIQTAVPEAMVSIDVHDSICTEFPDLSPYTAIGAGPGLGTRRNTCRLMHDLIANCNMPMVLDADALNILSIHKEWLEMLPLNTILTPHPGEFNRLTGSSVDSWQRIQLQREMAMNYKIIVVLKGAYTSVALPDGNVFFNSTGNPGMATAGSGDVLTGFILGLLAQNLSPQNAAMAGVYLHGLAGDIASGKKSEHAMVAHDIIDELGGAFLQLR
ncbi:MAG TPA: NAD(P)H-hydrate dehydratase [Mariniphaga sp.]|nr:NAD(P)H-hydrate dehydratase [Mariniphaga sp.]